MEHDDDDDDDDDRYGTNFCEHQIKRENIWHQKRNVQEAQDIFDREFHVLKDLQMEPNIYPIRFIVFYPFLPLRIEYSNLAKSSFIYKLLTVRIEEA